MPPLPTPYHTIILNFHTQVMGEPGMISWLLHDDQAPSTLYTYVLTLQQLTSTPPPTHRRPTPNLPPPQPQPTPPQLRPLPPLPTRPQPSPVNPTHLPSQPHSASPANPTPPHQPTHSAPPANPTLPHQPTPLCLTSQPHSTPPANPTLPALRYIERLSQSPEHTGESAVGSSLVMRTIFSSEV